MTPDGWRVVNLDSLAQVNPEQLTGGTDPDYLMRYLDIAAIKQTGIIGDSRSLRFAEAPSRARRMVRKGDILVSTVRPYLRKLARVREAQDNLVVSTGYAVVRPEDRVVDGRFLYQHILSIGFVEHLKPRMSGSNYPAVTAHDVGSYPLSLPPLPEQHKIAAILSSVDDAIEKTQAVIDQARIVKRGLMQELFTRGLPGRSRRLKLTEIGSIPNEWTIRSLADTCIARGQYGANVAKRDFEPGGIRYIRITDIDDDGTLKDEAVGVNTRDADGYLLRTGDILFARSGATVGKTYLHVADDADLRCAFAGYLVRFRTRGQILLPEFLKEYLNTAVYWRWVAARQRAQAQPNINAAEYGQLPVPLPSLDEQRKIADVAAGFNRAIRAAMEAVRSHRRLKRALMSVLLTGELRVTPCYSIADELTMGQAARNSL